jgi:hypothetical protein
MIKRIIFLALLSTATASSAWVWTKAYHAAEHTVHKVEHAVNHQATIFKDKDIPVVTHAITHQVTVFKDKDIPVVTHAITHQAGVFVNKDLPIVLDKVLKPACRLGVSSILAKVIGQACTPATTEFEAECVAEFEVESGGMATAACTAATFVLKKGCAHELSKEVADLAKDEICGK